MSPADRLSLILLDRNWLDQARVVVFGPTHDGVRRLSPPLAASDDQHGRSDITGQDAQLYSLTCPLYFGKIGVAIPKYTKGKLTLLPKNKEGRPLTSRVEALDDPRHSTPYLLPPPGTVDKGSVATGEENGVVREIKEWQAIMDHLRRMPVMNPGELPTIPLDERATEVRAIRAG